MHNRQPLQPSLLWDALKDTEMWPIYLVGLSWLIPTNPITSYLSLQLKSLGYTTFETNLLTIPAYVLFIINLLFWTWLSEKINERLLLGLVSQFWPLPLLIALEVLPVEAPRWGRYALTIMLVGSPYVHAILVALTSRNAGSVRTRTVATSLYNMTVQMSSVYGSQVCPFAPSHYYMVDADQETRSTAMMTSHFITEAIKCFLVSLLITFYSSLVLKSTM